MPVGPYQTFGSCVRAQRRRGHSEDAARRICGAIEARTQKFSFVDEPADEPAWRRVHRGADRRRASLRRAWLDVVTRWTNRLTVDDGEALVVGQRVPMTVSTERLQRVLHVLFREGVEIGVLDVNAVQKRLVGAFVVGDDLAADYAATFAARLITQLEGNAAQAATLRTVVSESLREGLTVRELSRRLLEVRPALGLDTPRARTLVNLERTLREAGRTRAFIDHTLTRQAGRLLRQRARTIARHETLSAMANGRQTAWGIAQREGLLSAEATRVWITTPDDRICPQCLPQDGLEAPLGQPFELRAPRTGSLAQVPQDIHAQCRCAEGIGST